MKPPRMVLQAKLREINRRLGVREPIEHAQSHATSSSGGVLGDDSGDVAMAEIARVESLAERERLLLLRKDVVAALDRIADGTYGLCADCSEAIGKKRLDALPFAARCVGCQAAQEASESCNGRSPVWEDEP